MESVALWVVSSTAIIGVIYTIWKNGRGQRIRDEIISKKQTERDGEIKGQIIAIRTMLDDKSSGLPAVNQKLQDFKLDYVEKITALIIRASTVEREVHDIKKAKR